ncbi:TRAP transporter substrate-binding protein DctP [Enterovirga rhinocerotis]|uniref:TRAP-type C4-dicarboxylate transport system substrate-binding protein n=1 Tax=Enterovirga rhinocerotis TaxID=1339210 RepID=A0A4R7C508_9HYPH|nr:TRAP transporter substrate-binding protein DctP [Enterovirga rhinocerotis]TDR92942.1 TRAP-type C4-dicarboxylate transport system substrate-binding protein [Enterovirga rhinocerotis]
MGLLRRNRWARAATAVLAAGLATVTVQAASAQQVKLRGAHIFPANFVQSGVNLEDWAKRLKEKSGGRIDFEIIHGGALLTQADHLEGLAANLVDFASFYPIYYPGEFLVEGALTNIIDIWSDKVPDIRGVGLIHAQLHKEFPQFRAEYERRKMHMAVPLPADPYVIACKTEAKSMADLKNRKMRTFGRYFPVLQRALGVQPVTVPGPEAYQALSTGVIDCVYSTPDWIVANSLQEVAPYTLIPSPGEARPQMAATSVIAMNMNSYKKLPPDLRTIVDEVSAEMNDKIASSMQAVYDGAVKKLGSNPKGALHHMSAEDMKAWAAATPNQVDQAAADLEARKYPGKAIIARYRELAAAYAAGTWPAK